MNGQQALQLGKLVPAKVFFTKGVGTHKEELRSYELALRDAGIEKCNLVHVSSIFPPGCKILPKKRKTGRVNPTHVINLVLSGEMS